MNAEQYEEYGDPEPMSHVGRYTAQLPQRWHRPAQLRPEECEDYGDDPEFTPQMGRYTSQPTARRHRPTYAQPMLDRRSYPTSPSFAPHASSGPRRARTTQPAAASSLFTMLVCVIFGAAIAVACHPQSHQQHQLAQGEVGNE
jgi:hypothetical protein